MTEKSRGNERNRERWRLYDQGYANAYADPECRATLGYLKRLAPDYSSKGDRFRVKGAEGDLKGVYVQILSINEADNTVTIDVGKLGVERTVPISYLLDDEKAEVYIEKSGALDVPFGDEK